MRVHDPRTLGTTVFFASFGVAHVLANEYQRLAARGRMERAYAIHDANVRTRAANARVRSRRMQEDADAERAQLDVDLGLV